MQQLTADSSKLQSEFLKMSTDLKTKLRDIPRENAESAQLVKTFITRLHREKTQLRTSLANSQEAHQTLKQEFNSIVSDLQHQLSAKQDELSQEQAKHVEEGFAKLKEHDEELQEFEKSSEERYQTLKEKFRGFRKAA